MLDEKLKREFEDSINFDPMEKLAAKKSEELPVDYFDFYNSVSSVYSSKIEGENIDFDSFFKHKFLKVSYNPDYTKRSDDLLNAYEFILDNELNLENVLQAHKILSLHLLPENQRGQLRNNPMYVLNEDDRIEYVACSHYEVKNELFNLFEAINKVKKEKLNVKEVFYYGAQIHLKFVKIHPLQDGNGRTARLLEKWFLITKLGKEAVSIELEKNYFRNKRAYYNNIRQIGLEYESLDYNKSLDFLLMTIKSME